MTARFVLARGRVELRGTRPFLSKTVFGLSAADSQDSIGQIPCRIVAAVNPVFFCDCV
jgi:hypothetical protein